MKIFSRKKNKPGKSEDTEATEAHKKYRALLPVSDPDQYERYAEAFETIIAEPVTCVAVTGPYGAGKTSLLNAFIAAHRDEIDIKIISLATFEADQSNQEEESQATDSIRSDAHDESKKKDDTSRESSSQIEKSILQQLIYGVSADGLPYSRFRKIQKPSKLWRKSIGLSLFSLTTGFSIKYWPAIESYFSYSPPFKGWLMGIWSGIVGALLWLIAGIVIIRKCFLLTFGLSLKKLSLKNAEIETGEKSSESVFNRHLDELIYYFQETNHDFVLIEDLDRFKNTEIFTKIREINQLINENETIKENRDGNPIKFIFAIRDDLFKGKDRTKFFDFLIPVIPYVSSGNSYSILHERLKKAGLLEGLSKEFLRTVSVHINDNRHLLNTVNEYALYRDNLFSDDVAAEGANTFQNKLFAMVLYKNFYPNDFEALHHNDGVFAGLTTDHRERLDKRQAELVEERKQIDQMVEDHRNSIVQSRDALAAAYVGAICRETPKSATHFHNQGGSLTALNVGHEEIFSLLKNKKTINFRLANGSNAQIGVDKIIEAIHPSLTLEEKLAQIDAVHAEGEKSIKNRRSVNRQVMRKVQYWGLAEAFTFEEIKSRSEEMGDNNLFVYLVSRKYLDFDFVNYTSYFHEGATTANDRAFMLRFDGDGATSYEANLDTPREIVSIYGKMLFGKPQGFNVGIMDYILENRKPLVTPMVEGLRDAPSDALEFFESYYVLGKKTDALLTALISNWTTFVETASASERPLRHVQATLAWISERNAIQIKEWPKFRSVVETRASDVIDCPELAKKIPILAQQGIRLRNLAFDQLENVERATSMDAVIDSDGWAITADNALAILEAKGVSEAERRKHVFTLHGLAEESKTQKYVAENINEFVRQCLFEITESVDEDRDSIEKLTHFEHLDDELVPEIIERQNARLRFDQVWDGSWAAIVENRKFEISWDNFESYASEDSADLESIFKNGAVVTTLSTQQQKISETLFEFLINFDGMDDESYAQLIGPELGTIEDLPVGISRIKKLHLVQSGMVGLKEETYSWASETSRLKVALILKNFSEFQSTAENWPLAAPDVANLLKSNIPPQAKHEILVRGEDTIDWNDDPKLLTAISSILSDSKLSIDRFSTEFIESVISQTEQPTGLQILVRKIKDWDEPTVMRALERIGEPYEVIASYGKFPSLENSNLHLQLAQALKSRAFISSYTSDKKKIKINTKKQPD